LFRWDGKSPAIAEQGIVKVLRFLGTNVTDLSPLRVFQGLTNLDCARNSELVDLSPLRGLPLSVLGLSNTKVEDLSPLTGMPLTNLDMPNVQRVVDLAPLLECKSLKSLNLVGCKQIIPAQVASLQKALPNCKIEWNDPAKATPTNNK
jgi:hypothetical protein